MIKNNLFCITFLFCLLSSFQSFAFAHLPQYPEQDASEQIGYYSGVKDLPPNKNWMNNLPPKVEIRSISIPGTHGSAARIGGDAVRNQTLTITQQLNAGIRFLDLRLRHINNGFALHHGAYFQNRVFDQALNDIKTFLHENPSEFVFVRVKKEHTELNNSRSFEETFKAYAENYADIIWDIWSPVFNTNPNVEEVRGKIIFLQDFKSKFSIFGANYHGFNIQDNFHLRTNWDLYSKWEGVKTHIELANNNRYGYSGYINQLAGNTGSFPYFVASGHSSPSNNAPRLLTGLTTPGWENSYPDFPRVGCFIGICSIAFEGINTLTKNYLRNNPSIQYAGIVVADFPSAALIEEIINLNKRRGFWDEKEQQEN
ncbi:phosphatidylinositol-specific phospholipase C [Shewanella gaetbuli]|uniref:1-phosphatidylinositol phosphodiesterase n=1 Tax=Shewanella gaetbuli TaxID=220752 RepID=A0A9X2CGG1_9GAMM|nr:phosphatidylinositol-specific phospholipase C [Shewanella gaetbuli]MCL1142353.1 phosphatidylinositol-specific phospholipase C [Shewanella gaetbuli]